jgi:hypothetical protein
MDMKDQYRFILISSEKTPTWQHVLRRALAPLGQLEIMNAHKALMKVASEFIDLVIIDSGEVKHIIPLITQLRDSCRHRHGSNHLAARQRSISRRLFGLHRQVC